MGHGEGVLIMIGVSVVTIIALDFARPKQARVFAKGPNGETDLIWDPKSAPAPVK